MSHAERLPHTRPGIWPALREGRFARGIQRERPDGCALALVGLPDDTGVRLNGGRPGAALGPNAVRASLAGFGTPWDGLSKRSLEVGVFDAGDVEPAEGSDEAALLATHERVEQALRAVHELGLVPVCVGGGHDLSLPSIRALSRHAGGSLGGVNFDAHLDVRSRVGSGMAFRRLIEGGWLDARRFVEFGLGRFVNDAADAEWLSAQGATLILAEDVLSGSARASSALELALNGPSPAFLSIDLDGIDAAFVPGVSALNPAGLGVREAMALAELAGAAPGIAHFDVMELCPGEDLQGRSARIAAQLFLCFVAGFQERTG